MVKLMCGVLTALTMAAFGGADADASEHVGPDSRKPHATARHYASGVHRSGGKKRLKKKHHKKCPSRSKRHR
jgi:hypothetical protein